MRRLDLTYGCRLRELHCTSFIARRPLWAMASRRRTPLSAVQHHGEVELDAGPSVTVQRSMRPYPVTPHAGHGCVSASRQPGGRRGASGETGTAVPPLEPDRAMRSLQRAQSFGQLASLVSLIGVGVALSALFQLFHLPNISKVHGYRMAIAVLLAVGLYGATLGIARAAWADIRRIVLVVTVGVALKALLIGGALALALGDPLYLLLGVVVAQIDPLSVATLTSGSRMSERGQDLLRSWAAFDDPVTVLLTVSLVTAVGSTFVKDQPAMTPDLGGPSGVSGFFVGLALNLGLVTLTALLWRGAKRNATSALALTTGLIMVAAGFFLMLAVAIGGLILRPDAKLFPERGDDFFPHLVERTVRVAFYGAAVALGLLLQGSGTFALWCDRGRASWVALIA
ncbi:sodium/proton antiporter, CPA1 family [Frankia casuarinae]|uniref:Sodium/proton antiporter, CPA1 family n=2 Tax=Frankia casuarinae (strain DSM 45818 / CECT 9043 / HFP020203 / CcI3) TaxID=106370 RepID=Q2J5M6_FRACC|nr:sodium/proton antiporter, CPA1 family [Frankia casuarinae]